MSRCTSAVPHPTVHPLTAAVFGDTVKGTPVTCEVFLVAATEGVLFLGSPERHRSWLVRCDPLEDELGYRLIADVADGVLWTELIFTTTCSCGLDSSVAIATRYGLDGPGTESL